MITDWISACGSSVAAIGAIAAVFIALRQIHNEREARCLTELTFHVAIRTGPTVAVPPTPAARPNLRSLRRIVQPESFCARASHPGAASDQPGQKVANGATHGVVRSSGTQTVDPDAS
jgi:hypothetical protein